MLCEQILVSPTLQYMMNVVTAFVRGMDITLLAVIINSIEGLQYTFIQVRHQKLWQACRYYYVVGG
jgi:hypothetical protein